MELHIQSVTCHMDSHSVTFHPTQVNTPHLNPGQTGQYLTNPKAMKGLTSVTGYLPRWFTCSQVVNHPSINLAIFSQELNSQLVDYKSDALTTTSPSGQLISVVDD